MTMSNEGIAFKFTAELASIECFKCGVIFGVPSDFRKKRLEDKQSFFCPNGHSQFYIGKTEAEKLREELEATNRRLQVATSEAAKEYALRLKLERRISKGVCPKCRRHFTNVERHMRSKHGEK